MEQNGLHDISSRGRSLAATGIIILIMMAHIHCGRDPMNYTGDIKLRPAAHLAGKRIFIDPGHGGLAKIDRFRNGPRGITEEAVNLRVSMILADMLRKSGADIRLSRESDIDVPLAKRVDMVKEFDPALLVSVHHNGTVRRHEPVNYPLAVIWGTRHNQPQSYDFASLLLEEFHRIMDEKGMVLSDFSVFPETGSMLLRETRYVCPGVIGEAGFFSDDRFSRKLGDIQYNQLEAEAYYRSISEYFKRGIPSARIFMSCRLDQNGILGNRVTDASPLIALELRSGVKNLGINKESLQITLDDVPVGYRFITGTYCIIDYGERLHPGTHALRFGFQNARAKNSPIYRAVFTVDSAIGDYDRLIANGTDLIKRNCSLREGLAMLLSALSLGPTSPQADMLLWAIAGAFTRLGEHGTAAYYYARLYHFYPDSLYIAKIPRQFSQTVPGLRFPVDYLGKELEIRHDAFLCRDKQPAESEYIHLRLPKKEPWLMLERFIQRIKKICTD